MEAPATEAVNLVPTDLIRACASALVTLFCIDFPKLRLAASFGSMRAAGML